MCKTLLKAVFIKLRWLKFIIAISVFVSLSTIKNVHVSVNVSSILIYSNGSKHLSMLISFNCVLLPALL